jgi:hypothetical protein
MLARDDRRCERQERAYGKHAGDRQCARGPEHSHTIAVETTVALRV